MAVSLRAPSFYVELFYFNEQDFFIYFFMLRKTHLTVSIPSE